MLPLNHKRTTSSLAPPLCIKKFCNQKIESSQLHWSTQFKMSSRQFYFVSVGLRWLVRPWPMVGPMAWRPPALTTSRGQSSGSKRRRTTSGSIKKTDPYNVKLKRKKKHKPYLRLPGVNFINILHLNFGPILWHQKLQSWNVTRESWAKHFHMKNALVKCWWNWHQNDSEKSCNFSHSYYQFNSEALEL